MICELEHKKRHRFPQILRQKVKNMKLLLQENPSVENCIEWWTTSSDVFSEAEFIGARTIINNIGTRSGIVRKFMDNYGNISGKLVIHDQL